jgi:hypothetical protein
MIGKASDRLGTTTTDRLRRLKSSNVPTRKTTPPRTELSIYRCMQLLAVA